MKKLIIALIVLVLILIVIVVKGYIFNSEKESDTRKYINNTTMVYFVAGASKGDHYHREGCQYLSSIYRGSNLYTADVSTAQKMGLIPCPACNPPIPLMSEKENEEILKIIEGEKKQEQTDREKAAIDFLNGKKNPKYIQSMEFIPARKPNISAEQAIENMRERDRLKEDKKK